MKTQIHRQTLKKTRNSKSQSASETSDATNSEMLSDFCFFLQQELDRRCLTNPNYSLRAFAKFLDVDSSRLSKILRRERPINAELFHKFANRLGIDPEQKITFERALLRKKYQLSQEAVTPSVQYQKLVRGCSVNRFLMIFH